MLKRLKIRLKEVAAQKPISMSKLSRMSDVSYDTIQQLYHSPTKDVTLSTLEKLADALQVDVCELIDRGKEGPQAKKVADTPEGYSS